MKILVVNAGSSSLKYQLIDMEGEKVIAKGQVERIAIEGGHLKQTSADKKVVEITKFVKDHVEATEMMLSALQDPEKGVIKSVEEVGAVGHRVLHGGKEFSESVIINQQVKDAIRRCIPLGPLHNPANLMGIEACEKVMPTTPQVAVFDTAFHQTMPPKAYMYGVPKKYEETIGVRRYGFHGTSHRYVSKRVCEFLGVDPVGKKFIICHLGNGSSLSAVKDGKCQDTSMGLTPLEGLIMGTRCGSCDPAVVQFIANNDKKSVDEVLTMMNKQSGLLGIGGKSDMRDIDAAADAGDQGRHPGPGHADLWHPEVHWLLHGCAAGRGRHYLHRRHRREQCASAPACDRGLRLHGYQAGRGKERGLHGSQCERDHHFHAR